MYQILYELDYRRSQWQQTTPELPAEFKSVLINTPYTNHGYFSRLLLALAEQMIKTGTAIKSKQVKLHTMESY